MTIHIPVSDLEPEMRKLYWEGKLFDISVDFMHNSLMSHYNEKEITIYSFGKYIKMDNRLKPFTIYKSTTEIILEFR